MSNTISLSKYVKKRNGVSLGGKGSMSNMLKRSFGANSFDLFWQHWNPIWGYYLSLKVMKPLNQFFPIWLAIMMTFAVSGAVHDAAVFAIKGQFIFFFTPWFSLMSIIVIASKKFGISYGGQHFLIRGVINLTFIVVCFVATQKIESLLML